MMKVLVTGATGFIGARLVLKSHAHGHEVVALGRVNNAVEEERRSELERAGLAVTQASLTEDKMLGGLCQGCDLVFHLAAAQHEANVPDEHFHRVNVDGTRAMLEAASGAGVKRFVHGSTIGVYGSALEGRLDESSETRPDNIYGVTKLDGEQLVLDNAGALPVSIVRISETYGPGDRRLLKLFKAIKKGVFFMIGSGDNSHQLIFVDDLIEGLYRAASDEEALGDVFVLAGPEVLSTRQMVDTIAGALGVRPPRFRAPIWPFLGAAVALERTLTPLGIQPPLHRRRLDFFRKSFYFSTDKATRLLKFEAATEFAEGVAATAAWYESRGFL